MYHKRIFIGSDHGGFKLKGELIRRLLGEGYDVKDVGPFFEEPTDDYPDFAVKVCKHVLSHKSRGILICRSGAGMCISANKINGIYASDCWDEQSALFDRRDHDTNVLCLGARHLDEQKAHKIVKVWLETEFEGGRHLRRMKKIRALEKSKEVVSNVAARRPRR